MSTPSAIQASAVEQVLAVTARDWGVHSSNCSKKLNEILVSNRCDKKAAPTSLFSGWGHWQRSFC